MTSKTFVGGDGSYASAASWSPTGAPQNGDSVTVYSGSVTATNLNIVNEHIYLKNYGPALDLVLQKTRLGSSTTIMTVGEGVPVSIDTVGRVKSAGLIVSEHGKLDLNIGSGSSTSNFVNSGTVHGLAGIGSTTVDISVAQRSKFTNFGQARADGGGNTPGGIIGISGAGSVANSGVLMANDGTINVSTRGKLANSGSIISQGSGTFAGATDISFGAGFTNTGLIENGSGSAMNIASTGGSQLVNNGTIENSGSMTLKTAVQQSTKGMIEADGGTLTLGAAVTSGTINISNAMLEFGGPFSRFAGPSSLYGFTAKLDFTGSTGDLKFDDGGPAISEMLKGSHLFVFEATYPGAAPNQIADFTLTGGKYAANSFSVVSNDTIHYVRPPTA